MIRFRGVARDLSSGVMAAPARPVAAAPAALIGLVGLASAMGVGRFAFTPLLPLMQQAGTVSLARTTWAT